MSSLEQRVSTRNATCGSVDEPKLPLLRAEMEADASLRRVIAKPRTSCSRERDSKARHPAHVSQCDCALTPAPNGHVPMRSCLRRVRPLPAPSHHRARAATISRRVPGNEGYRVGEATRHKLLGRDQGGAAATSPDQRVHTGRGAPTVWMHSSSSSAPIGTGKSYSTVASIPKACEREAQQIRRCLMRAE